MPAAIYQTIPNVGKLNIGKQNAVNSSVTLERDGEPWFVAADVCKALEIGNPSQAIARLEDNEKMNTLISNEGAASGTSSMAFVNEPASTLLYWVPASLKPRCSNVG